MDSEVSGAEVKKSDLANLKPESSERWERRGFGGIDGSFSKTRGSMGLAGSTGSGAFRSVLVGVECSVVRGADGESACVHRLMTEPFFDPVIIILLSGDGVLVVDVDPNSEVALTMFCTKPRPFSRVRLGVSSLGAAVFWKALLVTGMGWIKDVCLASGCNGRARDGIVKEDLGRREDEESASAFCVV